MEPGGLCGAVGKTEGVQREVGMVSRFLPPITPPLCRLEHTHRCSPRTAAMCSRTIKRPGREEQAAHTKKANSHTVTDTYLCIFPRCFHSASSLHPSILLSLHLLPPHTHIPPPPLPLQSALTEPIVFAFYEFSPLVRQL